MSTAVAILLFFLIVTLIVVLVDISKRVVGKREPLGKYEDKYENIYIFSLPRNIEKIPAKEMYQISKKILGVFTALDYKDNKNNYMEESWHSWQVSLLIYCYKKDLELYIPHPKKVFKKEITELSDISLKGHFDKLLKKYKKEVKVHKNKEVLCKDTRWNGHEVAIMMHFLSKYKYFPKDK